MSSFDEMDAFEGASLSARAMAARPQPYLDGLNPAQRAAVEQMDGPVLMLAGAGTGKTKALTARIVHLMNTGRARPNEILAVTFTNKAAREMKTRVGHMLGQQVEGMPWLGTFHAICVKLLRRHAELVGLKSNFTILDTDDQLRLLKQLIRAENIDDKRWPARMLAGIIDGWKNRALTPDKVPAADAGLYNHRGTEVYDQYQRRLKELNAVDFGDLLLHMVTIFQTHPDILEQYQRWFKYILVDEYQDTNVAQYLWLRLLAQGHRNICCVGDDDQSIYGWRGAEVGNILRFETDFPGAHVVKLEQNYRSTPHILAAASGVIAGNEGRLGKTLWTEAEDGEKVRLIGHWDGEEEARWIGDEIEAMQRGTRGQDAISLDHMAILVRASHQMRAFEDRFLTIGLPYRVIGGPRFYERLEIRDAMAYFRVVTSPDDDLAFERIVNTPKRGLGDKAQQKIQVTAREHGTNLVEGARILLAHDGLGGKGGAQLRLLVDGIDRWGRMVGDEAMSHVELAEIILDESGYTGMWQNDKTPEAPGRLENLKELVKALEQFENLQGFLEHVSLIMDNESDDGGAKVSIMTLHAAKGLEFPAVFLPGWEDGLFPSQRSMDESGIKGLEEERRLAYVGITRAEELCTISFAANRRVFGQWQSSMPSRFIDELPEENVEVLTPPGLYGGGFGAAMPTSNLHDQAAEANVYNSPGWRRLQARAGERGMSQPKETRNVTIDMNAVSSFTMGERVFHQKFGYGAVIGIEGDKLEVEFEKAGTKKVVSRFLSGCDDVPF
ncbi:UvrD-helicase domain-containing protein [Sulfitobacter mediterraneus]|uniref:ATP-dependent helicase n=1 Tax=Sulfitobacter mediterraneus TaxID=83219 RepID=UPI001932E020|nr:UvrD-helicase domain-containing protein [Sulfitobacter mediterraneus]MBM1309392.1 UvrD-helicase domain-containing protein [Sulfitobacter mediterraneus]MBM1313277.1 UvrD-helicase domain-containing protein [Sulfitobacter mediterraneus]MBM1321661.1 UvrD-helicase domain-containing protein [Sulfitobacter mediterraneus]MBM1325548.1 UvrD-helicase domain-containing protein [Sulfitobacter mediterraneus]MBM1396894.1 UvrD-helicase domain-containing protein [Sulfitobacter mediterraneus]